MGIGQLRGKSWIQCDAERFTFGAPFSCASFYQTWQPSFLRSFWLRNCCTLIWFGSSKHCRQCLFAHSSPPCFLPKMDNIQKTLSNDLPLMQTRRSIRLAHGQSYQTSLHHTFQKPWLTHSHRCLIQTRQTIRSLLLPHRTHPHQRPRTLRTTHDPLWIPPSRPASKYPITKSTRVNSHIIHF